MARDRFGSDARGDRFDSYFSDSDEEIEYPDIEYKSIYGLAKVVGQSYSSSLNHTFTTLMTKTTFTMKTTEWRGEKKEAEDAVHSWNDETHYATTSAGTAPEGASGVDATATRFMIFANSATNNKGQTINFSKPLPVIVLPAVASRYEHLTRLGSMRFSAMVTGTDNFEITALVKVVSSSDDSITISINYDIPQDPPKKRGLYYQKIPMFKYSEYRVDLQTKDLTGIKALTYAYDDKNNKSLDVNFTYNLCRETLKGKVETFNGCQ